jgi:Ribosomal protein L7/L12 dimerisation domain
MHEVNFRNALLMPRYTIQRCQVQRRLQSTAAEPGASGKIRVNQLVEDISRLNLLETADLVSQLKVCFLIERADDRPN